MTGPARLATAAGLVLVLAGPAGAEEFRWRMEPTCQTLTLHLERQPGDRVVATGIADACATVLVAPRPVRGTGELVGAVLSLTLRGPAVQAPGFGSFLLQLEVEIDVTTGHGRWGYPGMGWAGALRPLR